MSNRTLRVNELIQRELSDILRKRYQADSVAITISSVEVSPDLRDGWVYISVLGEPSVAEQKLKWLRKHSSDIRQELGRRIILKYLPKFSYRLDETTERGNRILGILDEIGGPQALGQDDEPEADKSTP